jgi:hypothetical protein
MATAETFTVVRPDELEGTAKALALDMARAGMAPQLSIGDLWSPRHLGALEFVCLRYPNGDLAIVFGSGAGNRDCSGQLRFTPDGRFFQHWVWDE